MCCAPLTLPGAAFSQTSITQQPLAPNDKSQINKNRADTDQVKKNQSAKNQADKKQAPLKIENASLHVISDKMIAQRESSMVEFIGNVKATRLDSIVYADSIQVFFHDNNSKKNDSQNNVKQIISIGNVKYTAGDRKAFADKAVYTAQDEILILTGETAKLMTGSSFVTGKKITLYRLEDKVLVESDGTNRVEAMFNPEDNKR